MELHVQNRLDAETEALVKGIIGAVIEVHQIIGPGYFEKIYERALAIELTQRGFAFVTQLPVSIYYKGVKIHGQVLDLVVENKVVLELKSIEKVLPLHKAQLLSYLKSTNCSAGLLINFNKELVKDGITRLVRT